MPDILKSLHSGLVVYSYFFLFLFFCLFHLSFFCNRNKNNLYVLSLDYYNNYPNSIVKYGFLSLL